MAGDYSGRWEGGGEEKRGFLSDLDGAKTNPRHFRAGAPQPTSRLHEYCSGCLQSAIIGKRAGYFRGKTPPKPKRNPLLATPAAGGQAVPLHGRMGRVGLFVFEFLFAEP